MAHVLSRGLNENALLFGPLLPIRGRSHHLPDWRETGKKGSESITDFLKGQTFFDEGTLNAENFPSINSLSIQ